MIYLRYKGEGAKASASAACDEIHAFLSAVLPGYRAEKWADPVPHPEREEYLVPIDLEHRAPFVKIPGEKAEQIAAQEQLTEAEAEAQGFFPAPEEEEETE